MTRLHWRSRRPTDLIRGPFLIELPEPGPHAIWLPELLTEIAAIVDEYYRRSFA